VLLHYVMPAALQEWNDASPASQYSNAYFSMTASEGAALYWVHYSSQQLWLLVSDGNETLFIYDQLSLPQMRRCAIRPNRYSEL